jgi:hypothetical protein
MARRKQFWSNVSKLEPAPKRSAQALEEDFEVVSHPTHPMTAFLVIDPLFKIVRGCLSTLAKG